MPQPKNHDQILEAGIKVFSRYGIAKTTMADVAQEAQISRQTLYNLFENKDQLLTAVVHYVGLQSLREVEAAWATRKTLVEKLEDFHVIGPLNWFDQAAKLPGLTDLLECNESKTRAAFLDLKEQWRALFLPEISAYESNLKTNGLTSVDVFDFFYWTSMEAKHQAVDREDLMAKLKVIRISVVCLLPE